MNTMPIMPGGTGAMHRGQNRMRGSVFLFQSCMPVDATSMPFLEPVKDEEVEKFAVSVSPLPSAPGSKGDSEALPAIRGFEDDVKRFRAGQAAGPPKPLAGFGLGVSLGGAAPDKPDSPTNKSKKQMFQPDKGSDKIISKAKAVLDQPEQGLLWRQDLAPNDPSATLPACGRFDGLAGSSSCEYADYRPANKQPQGEPSTLPSVETSTSPSTNHPSPMTQSTPQSQGRSSKSPGVQWASPSPPTPGRPGSNRWPRDCSPSDIDDEELALEALDHMRNKPWNSYHWLEVRQQLIDDGRIKDLPALMKSVRASSARALKLEEYQLNDSRSVDLSLYLQPAESIRWFGRRNVTVPQMPVGLSGVIEPPIIVVDQSPLDVVRELQSLNREKRPICVVIEVSNFEKDGSLNLGSKHATSMAQQNVMVRTDFTRFATTVAEGLRGGKCSVRDHLAAQHDPYVFTCPGVTMFRGSRDNGYPFMETPMHVTTICCAMPSTRPAVTMSSNFGTGEKTEWYTSDLDQTALLERLSLIGFAALQDEDPDQKAILVLSALGCADRGLHPKDAVANSLKHWRQRFARLFHTVFLACGPDQELAESFDLAINRQLYGALLVEDISDFAEWHWSRSHVALHVNSMDFALIADMVEEERDKKEAEKEAQEEEEEENRKRIEEEKEMRDLEQKEREKMAHEDKYWEAPAAEIEVEVSTQASPEKENEASTERKGSKGSAASENESAKRGSRGGLRSSLRSSIQSNHEAPPLLFDADASPPSRQVSLGIDDKEKGSQLEDEEGAKQVTLLEEFSSAMIEHRSHEVKENFVDRQVDFLYKESRQAAAGKYATSSRSRSHSIVSAHAGGGGPRLSLAPSDWKRHRALSCMGFNMPATSRSPSACRSRANSSCDDIRSQKSNGSSDDHSTPKADENKDGKEDEPGEEDGDGKEDNGDSSSSDSACSRISSCSRMSSYSQARGSMFSGRGSIFSTDGRHSSSSRMSSFGGRRVSMVERKMLQQNRLSQVNGKRILGTGASGGKKKELSEGERLEQVRMEARKRLSCKKDAEASLSGTPSTVPSNAGSRRASTWSQQAAALRQSVTQQLPNNRQSLTVYGEEEKPALPRPSLQQEGEGTDTHGILLTVVELPAFESAAALSRRTSWGSSEGSRGPSRRNSKESTKLADDDRRYSDKSDRSILVRNDRLSSASGEAPVAGFHELRSSVSSRGSGPRCRFSLEDDVKVFGPTSMEPTSFDGDGAEKHDDYSIPFTLTVAEAYQENTLEGKELDAGSMALLKQEVVDDTFSASQGARQDASSREAAVSASGDQVDFSTDTSPRRDQQDVGPATDQSSSSDLGHATLSTITTDSPARAVGSLFSTACSRDASPQASPRCSATSEALSATSEGRSDISSRKSAMISEKLEQRPDLGADCPVEKHRTSLQVKPHTEEWQVRMDVQHLAATFKTRTEIFWSSPNRRRKVALRNPHIQRKSARRNSNEERGCVIEKLLKKDAEEEKGERSIEAEIMRAVAATPQHVLDNKRGSQYGTIIGIARETSSQAHTPDSPTSPTSPQEGLPPVKDSTRRSLKKKQSSLYRRFSMLTDQSSEPASPKVPMKFHSHMGVSTVTPDSPRQSETGSATGRGSGVTLSAVALKAVQGGGWPEAAAAAQTDRRSLKTGRRVSAERFMSAGPILTELASAPVEDCHKLADVSDTHTNIYF